MIHFVHLLLLSLYAAVSSLKDNATKLLMLTHEAYWSCLQPLFYVYRHTRAVKIDYYIGIGINYQFFFLNKESKTVDPWMSIAVKLKDLSLVNSLRYTRAARRFYLYTARDVGSSDPMQRLFLFFVFSFI